MLERKGLVQRAAASPSGKPSAEWTQLKKTVAP
jgi:hypothetical protein